MICFIFIFLDQDMFFWKPKDLFYVHVVMIGHLVSVLALVVEHNLLYIKHKN